MQDGMADDGQGVIFVTPSYRGDLDRFTLLRRSVRRFLKERVRHLVMVPRADREMFVDANRDDADVAVLVQEDVVDRVFYPRPGFGLAAKLFPSQAWRLERFLGRRGWVIQQIVKLNAVAVCEAPTLVVIDSDCFFFRDFSVAMFGAGERRLLLKQIPGNEAALHRRHINRAREILQLPPGSSDFHYMAYPAVLQRDWVLALHRYLEAKHGKPWQQVLYAAGSISEYSIYGIFVEEILKPDDLEIRIEPYNIGVWHKEELDNLADFAVSVAAKVADTPEPLAPFCVTFQSILEVPVDAYDFIYDRLTSLCATQSR